MHSFRIGSRAKAAVAALAIGTAAMGGLAPQPARADSAAVTRNIILGVAAAAAADIIYNNVRHKRQAANNTVIGQTRNGGTVYSDGRVVYPNGDVLYTSNGNGQPCAYNGTYNPCTTPGVYYPQNYAGQNHGNHYGQRSVDADDRAVKHHKKHDNDDRGRGDNGNGHGHGHDD